MVVRQEIRYATPEFQQRFAACVAKMQESTTAGRNNSEWFRLAGYHGWPSQYCAHGIGTFPTWHRAYLLDFEHALQNADRALGNDGDIGLPYWDWSDVEGPDGKEPFPKILSDPRLAQLPTNFFQPGEKPHPALQKPFKRNKNIPQLLKNANVAETARLALSGHQPWLKFASTQGGSDSCEDPHNSVHVCVGSPMSSVAAAAFDPTFWLHHCNVDRLIQKYLTLNPKAMADARELARSEHQQDPRSPDLFETAFPPFTHPLTHKAFQPAQAFTLEGLGYVYDKLLPTPDDSQELNEMPTFAVFANVSIQDLNLETYQLHVFLLDEEKEGGEQKAEGDAVATAALALPSLETDPEEFHNLANYAGMGSIFGGKEGCSTCANRMPFAVRVNITAALNRLNKSRYDVQLGVIAVDHEGQCVPLSATPLPKPEIQGPLFEDSKTDFQVGCKKTARAMGDVRALQKYLSFYGFYSGPINGTFDAATEQGVKKFQKSAGMPPNGIVCKTTKKWMTAPRFDTASSAKPGQGDKGNVAPRSRGAALTYWVGVSPANLDRERLLAEIQQACDIWGKATGCSWTRIESWDDCDVEILWHDQHYHSTLKKKQLEDVKVDPRQEIEAKSKFDGPGGQLAHSGFDFLHLDIAEHWLTLDQPKTFNGQFRIFHVVLHELGHVLGLEHSRRPQDLMSPFYDEGHQDLTASDTKAVQVLYPVSAASE